MMGLVHTGLEKRAEQELDELLPSSEARNGERPGDNIEESKTKAVDLVSLEHLDNQRSSDASKLSLVRPVTSMS